VSSPVVNTWKYPRLYTFADVVYQEAEVATEVFDSSKCQQDVNIHSIQYPTVKFDMYRGS
jgi:hypothetical protein